MTWQKIRELFPSQWVIIEAVGAYTEGPKHVIEEVHLADLFGGDYAAASQRYTDLHCADRNREYYVLHTDRVALNIGIFDGMTNRVVK
jgi:hypothetical protein